MTTEPAPTRLMLPPPALRSCLRAYIFRNTLGQALTEPGQRLNRFPASPLCSMNWFIEGEAQMVSPPPPEPPVDWTPMFLGGPRSGPIVSYNPGPVSVFAVMFFPEALHKLTGIDMAHFVDRFLFLEDALGPDWLAMADAVLRAPDDNTRMALVEAFLTPRWHAVHGEEQRPGIGADWVRGLALQAGSLRFSSGVRSVERRIKSWAGQPMRTLRRMGRAEQSFLEARNRIESGDGKVAWADVAFQGGYADQAHLSREAREITGLSPTELIRASDEDESYWLYRIWR